MVIVENGMLAAICIEWTVNLFCMILCIEWQDRRNFVRAPPTGVDFDFNYDLSYATAVAIMAEDSALEKMRFDLVPKIITEENFWRNYFYRVSLICQASDLGTLGAQESDENEGELRST